MQRRPLHRSLLRAFTLRALTLRALTLRALTLRALTLGALTLVCATPEVSAQEPPPKIPVEQFKQRRQELMKRVGSGVIVVRGLGKNGAGLSGFVQDDDFYYLTGVSQADAALILLPETGEDWLLVRPYSRFTAQWDGDRVVPSYAHAKKLQFSAIKSVGSLPRILRSIARKHGEQDKPLQFHTAGGGRGTRRTADANANSTRRRFERPKSDAAVFAANLAEMFPDAKVGSVSGHVRAMRGVKDQYEIACIKAATEMACAGIAEAMKSTRPGVYEFQIAAAARYVFHRMGGGEDAYAAIVGAGINGCVLHYSANSKKCGESELVVMDYAPTAHGYCSDVTRTFPTNGEFTPEQRKLVQDVHDVQKILIAMVKPGASLGQISRRCSQELRKRGYRSMHGPCHHVGLHVHDVGSSTLQPGHLITVEPGAYLRDKKMGCRIEDVILVTKDGNVNLSGHLPSTPEGIEALMKSQGVQQAAVGVPAKKEPAEEDPAKKDS